VAVVVFVRKEAVNKENRINRYVWPYAWGFTVDEYYQVGYYRYISLPLLGNQTRLICSVYILAIASVAYIRLESNS